MSKEIVLVKVNNGFAYATDADREMASGLKIGKAIKATFVQQSARTLPYHQRYWAGLIALTFEYWEPSSEMTTEAEQKLIDQFCKVLDNVIGGDEVSKWGVEFLETLCHKRAQKIQVPHKSKQGLHDWIKDKAGYYDIEITPTGPKRKLKSINFNAMSEEQFKEYYRRAFNVCWRYVLSLTFDNESEADNAVMQLLSVS